MAHMLAKAGANDGRNFKCMWVKTILTGITHIIAVIQRRPARDVIALCSHLLLILQIAVDQIVIRNIA